MSPIFKKALVNFAMIQTVMFASSVSIGTQLPTSNGVVMAVLFTWLLISMFTLLPSLAVSFLFAYLSK